MFIHNSIRFLGLAAVLVVSDACIFEERCRKDPFGAECWQGAPAAPTGPDADVPDLEVSAEPGDAGLPEVGVRGGDVGMVSLHFDRNHDGREDACELQFTGDAVWATTERDLRVTTRVSCFFPDPGAIREVRIQKKVSPNDDPLRRICLAPQVVVEAVRVGEYFTLTMPDRDAGGHAVTLEIINRHNDRAVGGETICYAMTMDRPVFSSRLGPRCDAAGLALDWRDELRRRVYEAANRMPPGGLYIIAIAACLLAGEVCAAATLEGFAISLYLEWADAIIDAQERDFGLDHTIAAAAHAAVAAARIGQGAITVLRDGQLIRRGPDEIFLALRSVLQNPTQGIALLNQYHEDLRTLGSSFFSTYTVAVNLIRLTDELEAVAFTITHSPNACRRDVDDEPVAEIIFVPGEAAPLIDVRRTDDDGDGVSENHGDCDDANAARAPGLPETCDNQDNDCDFITDDNLGSTSCGLGACRRTAQNCLRGVLQTCVSGEPRSEICGNLTDENCDGVIDNPEICLGPRELCNNRDDDGDRRVDEDFVCVLGEIEACTLPCGRTGSRWCVPGDRLGLTCEWSSCEGECGDACVPFGPEVCNGRDDDCRNGIDDGGVCDPPAREVCNGLDDDGDGDRDEDFACEQSREYTCPTPCSTWGTTICTAACRLDGPCTPPPEVCNDRDDDCRNGIDDGGVCPGCEFGSCGSPGAVQCAGGSTGRPQQCNASRCWVNLGDVCGGILDPCPQSCEVSGGTAQCVHHDPNCPVARTFCLDANTLATCDPGVLCARRDTPCINHRRCPGRGICVIGADGNAECGCP